MQLHGHYSKGIQYIFFYYKKGGEARMRAVAWTLLETSLLLYYGYIKVLETSLLLY